MNNDCRDEFNRFMYGDEEPTTRFDVQNEVKQHWKTWQAAWAVATKAAIRNQGEPSAEVVVLGNSMRELKWLNTDGLKSGDLLYTSAPTIPQGWQLVPIEPTEEMFAAGNPFMEGLSSLGEAWEAMLSAAPKGEQS